MWGHGKVTATTALALALNWVPGTGVGSPEQPKALRLFPNPATEACTLTFSKSMPPCHWGVWNAEGRRMLDGFRQDQTAEALPTQDWPQGIYVVRASSPDGTLLGSSKLIVLTQ